MTKSNDPCAHLSLPDTAGGATLRQFITGQDALDGPSLAGVFSAECVFDGLMYKMKGEKAILDLYTSFLPEFLESFACEAIAPAGDTQWILLTQVVMKGMEKPLNVVDVVTLDMDGKICRLDNCFDVSRIKPAEGADSGKTEE